MYTVAVVAIAISSSVFIFVIFLLFYITFYLFFYLEYISNIYFTNIQFVLQLYIAVAISEICC